MRFVLNDASTTYIYTDRHTLSLHDALPDSTKRSAPLRDMPLWLRPDICMLIRILGALQSGSSFDSGSGMVTSRKAPAREPLTSAAISASCSLRLPRAPFTRRAPYFIPARPGAHST